MKRLALIPFFGLLGALAVFEPATARENLPLETAAIPLARGNPQPEFVPGEMLVRFRDGTGEREAARLLRDAGAREARPARHGNHFRVILAGEADVEATVRRLSLQPEVDYAEPNFVRHKHQGTTFSPNDRLFRLQWNLRLIGAPRTWAIQKGKATVGVAVLDTGVAFENFGPFRKAPDWGSQSFLPGYDAVEGDGHPNDDEGHGTHTASTVAEATNNELGVAGLAFDCSIMPIKVLDERGRGSDFDVGEGLDYVTNFRQGGTNPVKVVNLSLGGPGSNDGENGVDYPAAYESVIAVGATDGGKRRAYYSDYGSALDLMAPGGDESRDDDGDGVPDFVFQQTFDVELAQAGIYDDFAIFGFIGTSSSAPHVAALAALLFSQGIGDARAVRAAMEKTAEDLGTPGRDDQFGHGLIRPEKALSGLGLAK
jgi:serine protease